MITVTVQYFGEILARLPAASEAIPLAAGATVRELVALLVARHGVAFGEVFFWPDGEPLPNVTILLDGEELPQRGGLDAVLAADARVRLILMPPLLGGG